MPVAPPRPYWKGYLKLSLVFSPVAVYSAISSGERVAFKQINRQTGNRLKSAGWSTRTPATSSRAAEKARGYEIGKARLPADRGRGASRPSPSRASHTIDIDQLSCLEGPGRPALPRCSPYYLVPNDKVGQDAFAVIRDAMRGKGMVALGRVVLAKRERVIMLQPWNRGLRRTSSSTSFTTTGSTSVPFDDGRSIGEDCRDCTKEIVADAVAKRALKAAPVAT